MNPIDRHIYQLVYRSFRQINLHLLQGALLGLECIFALLSFIEVIIQIRDKKYYGTALQRRHDPLRQINLTSFLLPVPEFISVPLRLELKNRQERMKFMILRFTIGIAYWTVLVLTLISFSNDPEVTLYRETGEVY